MVNLDEILASTFFLFTFSGIRSFTLIHTDGRNMS